MSTFAILFGKATKMGFNPKDSKDALTIIGPFNTKELAENYWSEQIEGSVWIHEIEEPKQK